MGCLGRAALAPSARHSVVSVALTPYGIVAALALALLIPIARSTRGERARACWAWSLPEPQIGALAPVVDLAIFALRRAGVGSRALRPVVRACSTEMSTALKHRELWSRLRAASGNAPRVARRTPGLTAIEAWLRLVSLKLLYGLEWRGCQRVDRLADLRRRLGP